MLYGLALHTVLNTLRGFIDGSDYRVRGITDKKKIMNKAMWYLKDFFRAQGRLISKDEAVKART